MNPDQTILLVDDSENDRLFMQTAFKRAGFLSRMQEVRDGEEAIAYLDGTGQFSNRERYPLPSLMMLDLNMPRKDGFEVIEWVRTQSGLRRLSVIVLSASMRMEDIERAFDLGANSFLVKPSTLPELVEMMRSMRDWLRYNHFPPLNQSVGQG